MMLPTSQFTQIIGNIAVVTTIIQFLSGILVCKQYVRNKTTGEASALPFLFGVTSTGLWMWYGCIIQDDKIIFVNAVGLILMMGYSIVFYKYAYKRKVFIRQILLCVIFGLALTEYLSHIEDVPRLQSIIGFLACNLTLLTVAAPLVKLYHVIKVKSTECLPFHMIVMSFFVSAIWMVYGYLNMDAYLIVPNIIGSLLATAQLSLFLIYPRTPPNVALQKTVQA